MVSMVGDWNSFRSTAWFLALIFQLGPTWAQTAKPGPPIITTNLALPRLSGQVGVASSQTLAAAGGVPPYSSWTVTSGSIASGVSLLPSTSTIGGTPPSFEGKVIFNVTSSDESAGNRYASNRGRWL
jgi:hypothetical protein